jgi:hypothetical protein
MLQVFQKINTSIIRGGLDSLMIANNGQRGIPINYFPTSKERNKFEQGDDYEFDPRAGAPVIRETYNELPGVFYQLQDKFNAEAAYLTGINPQAAYQTGNGSMNTPGSALTVAQLRQLDIVRAIALNGVLVMLQKWALYAAEFISIPEWERLVGKENVVEIPEDTELFEFIELNMDISTHELDQKKMEALSFIFQTVGPNSPPEIQFKQQASIYELSGRYADADFMRHYTPQPDPAEAQYKQLEMAKLQKEVESLDADIKLVASKIDENVADVRRKIGDAAYKESQTNIAKATLLDKLQGKREQLEMNKHLSALASKERIQQSKVQIKGLEFDVKRDIENNKKILAKSVDAFNRKKFADELNFKYESSLNSMQSKIDKGNKSLNAYDRIIKDLNKGKSK